MRQISEQLLSYAENELIDKESIRRTVLSQAPQKQRKPVAWAKILLPVAAGLILVCAAVLAIPEARAEVARWFQIRSPEQYLTEDPESRRPNKEIESLIVPPETSAPVGEQITYVCDKPIWQQIAGDFRIDPGETMYDGDELYITVSLHGLTALPELDAATGGSATMTKIPLERIGEYTEDGKVPKEYASGLMSFYDDNRGFYCLAFPDGVRMACGTVSTLSANPEYEALQKELFNAYGDELSDADREAISARSIEWLKDRTLVGVVHSSVSGRSMLDADGNWIDTDSLSYLMKQTDENGMLTATLLYRAAVDENGDGNLTPLLEADLGTVRFNLDAINRLEQEKLTAETADVTFGPQTVRLNYTEWGETVSGDRTYATTNLRADLNGLTMTVEDGGTLDSLGVHDVCIRVALPEHWSDEMCKAFEDGVDFFCEIDGKQYAVSMAFERVDTHTLRYRFSTTEFPYDRVDSIGEIRLIPQLLQQLTLQIDGSTVEMEDDVRYSSDKGIRWSGDWLILTDGILRFVRSK